jgi:hypothetical protein
MWILLANNVIVCRFGFTGVVGGKAARADLKSRVGGLPARACPANTRWADE